MSQHMPLNPLSSGTSSTHLFLKNDVPLTILLRDTLNRVHRERRGRGSLLATCPTPSPFQVSANDLKPSHCSMSSIQQPYLVTTSTPTISPFLPYTIDQLVVCLPSSHPTVSTVLSPSVDVVPDDFDGKSTRYTSLITVDVSSSNAVSFAEWIHQL